MCIILLNSKRGQTPMLISHTMKQGLCYILKQLAKPFSHKLDTYRFNTCQMFGMVFYAIKNLWH